MVEEKNLKRLFIDMDGTLAKFQPVDTLEKLYEKGYFYNLEPQLNVVGAIKEIARSHPKIQVYVMSAVLVDSPYALDEKKAWLDKYLPEIDEAHRIFPACGENKLDHVPSGIRHTDYLLDDYTHNLTLWEPPAKGIKLLNGINHTNGTWEGNRLRYDKPTSELMGNIVDIIEEGREITDDKPLHQLVSIENEKYGLAGKSGFLSEYEKSNLTYLSRREALEALCEGIHICSVNEFPYYHGSHADEYAVMELKSQEAVEKLYGTRGTGIVHAAYISPYYQKPEELKRMLQEHCTENKKKELIKAGIRPTDSLLQKLDALESITNKNITMKELEKEYRKKDYESLRIKNLVEGIAQECKEQEKIRIEKTVVVEMEK